LNELFNVIVNRSKSQSGQEIDGRPRQPQKESDVGLDQDPQPLLLHKKSQILQASLNTRLVSFRY
jgi:hypothetical protein